MVEINLLPWRKLAREKRKKFLFECFISSVLIAFCIVFVSHEILNYQLEKKSRVLQKQHDQLLHISSHAKKVEVNSQVCEQYATALKHINALKIDQKYLQDLLKKIQVETPEEITLTHLEQRNHVIFLKGVARSAAQLTKFVEKFPRAQIIEVKNQTLSSQFYFQIQVMQDEVKTKSA